MSLVTISVQELSKCYRIFDHPKDRLKQAFWKQRRQYFREFWALQDVSFEVLRGETLGVIGRNGSGKSTLLQLICGTLTPTSGSITTNGRIAALLELGSGFNPEFTGLENVYLNGSFYGLSRQDVESRLDDILAFADIGDFVHQPVKTYSSGMQVRLAFAVIAHINADILIIDEALSVGDIFFTQKCMRFIKRFAEDNSLLFVSHDTSAVTSICNKSLMLRDGRIAAQGTPRDVILIYLKDLYSEMSGIQTGSEQVSNQKDVKPLPSKSQNLISAQSQATTSEQKPDFRKAILDDSNLASRAHFPELIFDASEAYGTGEAELLEVDFLVDEKSTRLLTAGEKVSLMIKARCLKAVDAPIFAFTIRNAMGQNLFGDNTCISHPPGSISLSQGQVCECQFRFYWPHLTHGEYTVEVAVAEGVQLDWRCLQLSPKAVCFQSEGAKSFGLVGIPMLSIEMTPT
ncbi:ABC transporter ATP-binding protein [Cyanobium sp. Copco_Reservoir_LC18]|jgi:lipopolysaccharide transport system ATP-binding protein|uniref:ABC transporter ATP-binding protein n=1 Tax=Cyanobium sp. Copco_Reservoir_LC18 TaxID=1328305 RepID=UPI00135A2EC4|nr:ABC transporter ATP-binding protein [Cyanobium sp. Copco_Reservoir_LC18]